MTGRERRPVDQAILRRAIERSELFLAYQPKIELISGRLIGVEALVRWQHPDYGIVAPGEFIPLAESSGLIQGLTQWVVAAAAAQWKAWAERGLLTRIAINVSAKNLDVIDFPDFVERVWAEHGIDCRNLTIELTESATQKVVNLLDTLTRFRLKGVRVSLDDFGTGYSSLIQLHQLPFSEIKIDRSFVMNADSSRSSRVIVASTIGLAHNLGLEAVAEGVETASVLRLLTELGCDAAQGYHIGRPMPAAQIVSFAASRGVVAGSLRDASKVGDRRDASPRRLRPPRASASAIVKGGEAVRR